MSSQTKFYLGRNQKIFGPVSADEVEALKRSGQLSAYTWLFKEGNAHWTPIDPPPAIPGEAGAPDAVEAQAHALPTMDSVPPSAANVAPEVPLRVVRSPEIPRDTYRVVLFDARNAISGWLSSATEAGCELVADQNGPDPLFVIKSCAFLTLHDARSGETMKLRVRVSSISRTQQGRDGEPARWRYRVRWEAIPALIDDLSHKNRGQRREVAA